MHAYKYTYRRGRLYSWVAATIIVLLENFLYLHFIDHSMFPLLAYYPEGVLFQGSSSDNHSWVTETGRVS